MSETWLEDVKDFNVEMEGYELFTLNRNWKKAGGVALYVDTHLRCTIVDTKTTAIDGIMECITVEIVLEDRRKIVVSCLYRMSGSCIDTFNLNVGKLFINVNTTHILCGDFNIDLLKSQKM